MKFNNDGTYELKFHFFGDGGKECKFEIEKGSYEVSNDQIILKEGSEEKTHLKLKDDVLRDVEYPDAWFVREK